MVPACCCIQGRNVVIFYGSQTGTAEEFAGRLAKDASRYGMKAVVADPEESDMVLFYFIVFQIWYYFSLLFLSFIFIELIFPAIFDFYHYVADDIL